MIQLQKLKKGDKVAILSPSFAAPGQWPHVYELGLKRVREVFELEPVEFPATKKLGASKEERSKDLIDAFENPEIKAVIASLGGDDQVTYVKNLPAGPFIKNPKPFFGYSDNTHFANFLWLNGIPSFYGGALFTQFAMQKRMDEYTIEYLKHALFGQGEVELRPSDIRNDMNLDWNNPATLNQKRVYEQNEGWFWDSPSTSLRVHAEGITWGGCLEVIDDLLRCEIQIPSLEDFKNIILITETSEDIPESEYVFSIYRALGERGILERVQAVLVGRPKAWEYNKQNDKDQKEEYRKKQRETILKAIRMYNTSIPVVQNLDFGHTDPQIAFPYGKKVRVDSDSQKVFVEF